MSRLAGALLVLAAAAGGAWAEELPDGFGVSSPSGSIFQTEIGDAADVDDYVFDGFAGQTLKVTLSVARGAALDPVVEVLRPGGSSVTGEGLRPIGPKPKVKGTFLLDATGTWKVRVRGDDGTTGAYKLKIAYSGAPSGRLPEPFRGGRFAGVVEFGETDVFPFSGFPGQKLAARVRSAAGSELDPRTALARPDGSVAAEGGASLDFVLDAAGEWRLSLSGVPPTEGAYSLQLTAKAPRETPSLEPDGNGQYRAQVPAVGGARLGFTLKFTGDAPELNALRGPDGKAVPGVGAAVRASAKKLALKSFLLPESLPQGTYTLTFDVPDPAPTNAALDWSVALPKGERRRKATMDAAEPVVSSTTLRATNGATVTIGVLRVLDPKDPDPESVRAFVGPYELLHEDPRRPGTFVPGVDLVSNNTRLVGRVPQDAASGFHTVSVWSSTGQVAVAADRIEIVEPPRLTSAEPPVGTAAGFELTLLGEGFNTRPFGSGILLDTSLPLTASDDAAVTLPAHAADAMTFEIPSRPPGIWYVAVIDKDTGGISNALEVEFLTTAGISRVVPSLVPILGGDAVHVNGTNFRATDEVLLETAVPGVYETVASTFLSEGQHRFAAPARPKGSYRIFVRDDQGFETPTRTLSYFSYADVTATLGLVPAPGGDLFDGFSSALADYDLDGDEDLFLSRRGGASKSSSSETRVLANDGTGRLVDVTSSAMPAPSADDDWRADRVWATDMTEDGIPDLVLVTDSKTVPSASKSHVRILVNEQRSAQTPERVFRDRTDDLMAPVRTVSGGGGGVGDNWRGLDMWIGDVDAGTGPPEILIVYEETKDEINVFCGNYCASPYAAGVSYAFYWGGSRAFKWDASKRGGLGQYKFEHNFFPRRSGVTVPIAFPQGIPACNAGTPCKGKFTPFVGQRIAVGAIDGDPKPDIAVLSNGTVQRDGATISSLQVALNRFDPQAGVDVTDVTQWLTDLLVDFRGDAVAIGHPGYPDGNSYGFVAVSQTDPSGATGPVLRIVRYDPAGGFGLGTMVDVTDDVLPAIGAGDADKLEASAMQFVDVDGDGDQDLVLLAPAAPGGTQSAFRILRNVGENGEVGLLRDEFAGLFAPLVTASEHFEGACLAIGDLDGDGGLDYVVTRGTPDGTASQTRALATDE